MLYSKIIIDFEKFTVLKLIVYFILPLNRIFLNKVSFSFFSKGKVSSKIFLIFKN